LELASHLADRIHDIDSRHWAPWFSEEPPVDSPLFPLLEKSRIVLSYLPDPDGNFERNLRSVGVRIVLTHPSQPPPEGQIHATDHLLQPLGKLNIQLGDPTPEVLVTAAEKNGAEEWTTGIKRPLLLIHPGSGGKQKCWSPEGFAETAHRFTELTSGGVILTGGPADGDLADRVAQLMRTAPNRRTPDTPREFAALLAACSVYLGNDSGPSHLAVAVGTPAVVLFGPTDPGTWAPRGKNVVRLLHAPDLASLPACTVVEALLPLAES
jgi:ADP-heptose:LPS heptosyltransferase